MKLNRSVEKGTKSYFTSFQEVKKTSFYLKYFTKYIQFCFVCYMMGHECYPLIILIYVNRKLRYFVLKKSDIVPFSSRCASLAVLIYLLLKYTHFLPQNRILFMKLIENIIKQLK